MNNSVPHILFTTELSEEQISKYHSGVFKITSIPFISFEYKVPALWKSRVSEEAEAWVFTSKNAIKAIRPVISDLVRPPYIFAVGQKTGSMLEKLGLQVITPDEYNLNSLAQRINEFKLKHIVHFSGNLKAGNLNNLLKKGMILTSIEVYRTKLIPQEIDESKFDGVVFMSPSAVESFMKKNSLNEKIPVFCIGPTTGEAARKLGIDECIIPKQSTLDSLFESIQTYYA